MEDTRIKEALKTLEISNPIGIEELKKQYRTLLVKWDIDNFPNDKNAQIQATQKLKNIFEAFTYLQENWEFYKTTLNSSSTNSHEKTNSFPEASLDVEASNSKRKKKIITIFAVIVLFPIAVVIISLLLESLYKSQISSNQPSKEISTQKSANNLHISEIITLVNAIFNSKDNSKDYETLKIPLNDVQKISLNYKHEISLGESLGEPQNGEMDIYNREGKVILKLFFGNNFKIFHCIRYIYYDGKINKSFWIFPNETNDSRIFTESIYEYEGEVIKKRIFYNKEGKLSKKFLATKIENNKLIESIEYGIQEDSYIRELKTIEKYMYDFKSDSLNPKLIKRSGAIYSDGSLLSEGVETYSYSKNKKTEYSIDFFQWKKEKDENVTIYFYDNFNNLIKKEKISFANSNGKIQSSKIIPSRWKNKEITTYKYNKHNSLIEEKQYFQSYGEKQWIALSYQKTYNKNNKVIQTNKYTHAYNGEIKTSWISYKKYNTKGDIIESKYTNEFGELESLETKEYYYLD